MTKPETVVPIWNVIAEKPYRELHEDIKAMRHTHYWMKGGRGSLKSSTAGVEIPLGIMRDPNANAVVLRKVRDTLKDSVYEQLEWAIEMLQVSHLWTSKVSPLSLTYKPTGQQILFRGADKPKRIKSLKFRKGYCRFIWYEELDEFGGPDEIRIINQSLMRGGPVFTVFYTYNPPKSANSWVNGESQLTRPDRYVHHSTYLDVPREWLGEVFFIEAEHLKATKEDAYRHEYLGEVVGSGGEVFPNVQIRRISEEEISTFENIKRGMDFGFATDPFAANSMHYDRKHRRLFIYHELHEIRLSNKKAYELLKASNPKNEPYKADSSEPKSIYELVQYGLRVFPARKGPDSVEYGIKFLQDLDAIVIDDTRCPETAREFLYYELDRDSNGNFKNGYPDRNNHHIDATRYAMEDESWKLREERDKKPDPDGPRSTRETAMKALLGDTQGGKRLAKW